MPIAKSQQKAVATRGNSKTTTSAQHRTTDTHIFFWGGVLSNWAKSPAYRGARCFEILLPELNKLQVQRPSADTFASRLISDHGFTSGEQWMMAMKGWLFESDVGLAGQTIGETGMAEEDYQKLKADMYLAKTKKEWVEGSSVQETWESTICKVLRSNNPRQQKGFGRQARGFDGELWDRVNMACVVAACVARAEVDPVLREMYQSSGDREFVEGSPTDTIWGVGLHWESTEIDDPLLWQGENRLGRCHDLARLKIREIYGDGVDGSKSNGGSLVV